MRDDQLHTVLLQNSEHQKPDYRSKYGDFSSFELVINAFLLQIKFIKLIPSLHHKRTISERKKLIKEKHLSILWWSPSNFDILLLSLKYSDPFLKYSDPFLKYSDPFLKYSDPFLKYSDPFLLLWNSKFWICSYHWSSKQRSQMSATINKNNIYFCFIIVYFC